MKKYYIDRIEDLNQMRIITTIQDFQTSELPKLQKYKHYYDGRQKILQRIYADKDKPNNRIVVNYCYSIVQNFLGYIAGIPIQYDNGDESLNDVLNYNDVTSEDSDLLKDALIFGEAFEIEYIDSDSKQRFKKFDPRECIPIYSSDLDEILLAVIRFYKIDPIEKIAPEATWKVEVYLDDRTDYYLSGPGFATLNYIDTKPNYFNQCPVTPFEIEDSIFKQIIDLQDAYNSIISDSLDDFDAFADAYLMLKGMSGTTEEDIAQMKKDKVLLLDNDGDASYLVKSMANAETQQRLDSIELKIYKIANCVDFYNTDFITSAASGTSLRYRLIGMENKASNIVSQMTKALQRRVELIYSILSMTDGESLWRDVEINFTRNIPDLTTPQTPAEIMAYRNFVSDKTLLAMLPFVKDPEEEIAEVQKQLTNTMNMYSFGDDDDDELLDSTQTRRSSSSSEDV